MLLVPHHLTFARVLSMSAPAVRPPSGGAFKGTLLDVLAESGSEDKSGALLSALRAVERDAGQLPAQLCALLRQVTTDASASDTVADSLAQWVRCDDEPSDGSTRGSSSAPSEEREAALLDAIWMLDQELDIYAQLADEQSKTAINSEHAHLNAFTSQLIVRTLKLSFSRVPHRPWLRRALRPALPRTHHAPFAGIDQGRYLPHSRWCSLGDKAA